MLLAGETEAQKTLAATSGKGGKGLLASVCLLHCLSSAPLAATRRVMKRKGGGGVTVTTLVPATDDDDCEDELSRFTREEEDCGSEREDPDPSDVFQWETGDTDNSRLFDELMKRERNSRSHLII